MLKVFIVQAIAAGIAVLVASKIIPGVRIRKAGTAIGVAVAFAVLNLFVGWFVRFVVAILLLPAALLTFGLVYLVLGLIVNSILLYVTDRLIDDFEIKGLWPLVCASGLISVAGWLLPRLF
ncbi:MAG TPA: phage holin family protein [Polyangiaceae bacterium]|jgi:putative membrane protein|nr:phage holin family protein [Polyangiaceae bacterium]